MAKEAEHVFKAFSEGDEKKYGKVIEKFDERFVPKKNILFRSEHAFIAACKEKEKRWKLSFEICTSWQNIVISGHREMSKSETELLSVFWINHFRKNCR